MARPPRIEFPGAIYRVTARGNAREAIVRDDADGDLFLDASGEVVMRFGWLCHAYPATVGAIPPPSGISTHWLLSQYKQ
jgi:hypothetical protein